MRNFTVIVADDEPQILQGMCGSIPWEALGFSVIATAGNGREVLELTQTLHPDLLISDIRMPFMDGLEVAQILHEDLMHIKIVLFSGWDDFEYARRAIRYGVSEYVLKPIDFEEMQQLLRRMHEELEQEFDARSDRQRQEALCRQSLPLLREQFLMRLAQGKLDQTAVEQQLSLLEMELRSDCFAAAVLRVPEQSDALLTQMSVRETVGEMLDKVCSYVSFSYFDKTAFLLLLPSEAALAQVLKSLNEAAHMTQRFLNTGFSCGVGLCCASLPGVAQSFKQANEALEYNVVSMDESVTSFQDILTYGDGQEAEYSTEALELAIRQGETEQIHQEADRLIVQVESCHYNFNEYQIAILEILFSISKLYRRYHLTNSEDLAGSKRMTMKILSLQTGEQLNNWLHNYCDYTSRAILRRQIDQNSLLAQHAKEFVDQHYGEPDLSVDTLCQELHVSPSHFSNIFRRETGTGFLNYLTGRRMEAAAHLLRTTDYKSRVIGEMVGYPEPNYFSYVFKKHMKVSPAKFRRQEE